MKTDNQLRFTDTHTHLYVSEFDADRAAVVERALSSRVSRMILPNIDIASIEPMRQLAASYPDNMRMAMALHPTELPEDWREGVNAVIDELHLHRSDYVAVGETGIDLYWDKSHREEQMQAFEMHLSAAREEKLPVIIHCREGLDETLEVLKNYGDVSAVFHCFCGTAQDAERIRKQGDYYFGIGGVVTFKNSKLSEVLPVIGPDRILLETDSPYLAPVPNRGRRNETSFIRYTAACVSTVLGIDIQEVSKLTCANSERLFGF